MKTATNIWSSLPRLVLGSVLGPVLGTIVGPVLCLAQPVVAQTDRELHSSRAHYVFDAEMGQLSVDPKSNVLEWIWGTEAKPREIATARLALPSFYVGSVKHLGNLRFLVMGRVPNGAGVLARVRCTTSPTRAIVVDELRLYDDIDFTNASWNEKESKLYVLDYVKPRVLHDDWKGPTRQLPAEFKVVVDEAKLPLLQADRTQVQLSSADLAAGFAANMPPSTVEFRVTPSDAGWSISELDSRRSRLTILERALVTTNEMRVQCPYPTLFEVIDLTSGRTVKRGSISSAKQTRRVRFRPRLTAGMPYELRESGHTSGTKFWPLRRIGRPVGTASLTIARGRMPAAHARVGQMIFAVGAECQAKQTIDTERRLRSTLWVAARAPRQAAPVRRVGKAAILRPDFVKTGHVKIAAQNTASASAFPMPLPRNPILAGSTLYFQIVLQNARDELVAFSDVFATTLLAKEAGGDAGESAPRLPAEIIERLEESGMIWQSGMDKAARRHSERLARRMAQAASRKD